MDTGRVLFLVVGVVIVIVVGRLLAYSGKRYLVDSAPGERGTAGSAATLVSTLFHLLTLGVLALIAVIPMGEDAMQNILVRMGLLLIVLAVIYGIALTQINRRRQDALVAEMESQYTEHKAAQDPVQEPAVRAVEPDGPHQRRD